MVQNHLDHIFLVEQGNVVQWRVAMDVPRGNEVRLTFLSRQDLFQEPHVANLNHKLDVGHLRVGQFDVN